MRYSVLFILGSLSLYALDTTEPYDPGFSGFELIGSYSGIGSGRNARAIGWEGLAGIGMTRNFSASLIFAAETDDYLAVGENKFAFELFYTAVDLDKFDLDIFGGIGTGGGLGMGMECNIDFPGYGFQLVVEEKLENKINPDDELSLTTGLVPLAYCSLSRAVQLLAGLEFSLLHNRESNDRAFNIGAASIGVNLVVVDAIELLTEAGMDIPQDEEGFSMMFAVQLIATLPTGENQ
ncbi:hypothetical protein ACFL5V_06780 [Fibrobacterota bacterium]